MIDENSVSEYAVRILICDDDPIICEALEEKLLSGRSSFSQALDVLTCQSAAESLVLADTFEPDIILMDLFFRHQAVSGIDALEHFKITRPHSTRIALTAFGSDYSMQDLRRLKNCDLDGFIDKCKHAKNCLDICFDVWQGTPFFEHLYLCSLDSLIPDMPQSKNIIQRQPDTFILGALNEQLMEVTQQLGLSEDSVKKHFQRIESRLEIDSPSELLESVRQKTFF